MPPIEATTAWFGFWYVAIALATFYASLTLLHMWKVGRWKRIILSVLAAYIWPVTLLWMIFYGITLGVKDAFRLIKED